ncbi:hypothetical protein C6P46_002729 [Rhodotorula mucilaginosa]|uniref:Uncharacterized protein n=1 Tax=Rhodotorula mucilaginosa TaxID=5537 RepID=A0A9P7B703_RHOMI|nr:hypothetical protein C6P46_002729 [Rhodotorula mucilaginosa]
MCPPLARSHGCAVWLPLVFISCSDSPVSISAHQPNDWRAFPRWSSPSGFEFDPAGTWLDLVLTSPLRERVDVGMILCDRVIKPLVGAQVPSRTGDQVSAERNILRCSAIRARDTGWLEGEDGLFDQMTDDDLCATWDGMDNELRDRSEQVYLDKDILRSDEETLRSDEDILKTLTNATEWVAGAFKARSIPKVMRIIACVAMDAGRTEWRCASLNEYVPRDAWALYTYNSCEERNPSPGIANTARHLDKDVENLELYPRLMREESKAPLLELAPRYEPPRARSRLTYEATAGSLTSCHRHDSQPDYENGAFSGQIGKLLMRHFFPKAYTYHNSV